MVGLGLRLGFDQQGVGPPLRFSHFCLGERLLLLQFIFSLLRVLLCRHLLLHLLLDCLRQMARAKINLVEYETHLVELNRQRFGHCVLQLVALR